MIKASNNHQHMFSPQSEYCTTTSLRRLKGDIPIYYTPTVLSKTKEMSDVKVATLTKIDQNKSASCHNLEESGSEDVHDHTIKQQFSS